MFLHRVRPGSSSRPELQVFILVSHLVPRPLHLAVPLPLWAAGGRHVSVGASVGDSADVRKQGPTHTAWFSVSPGCKHICKLFSSPTPPPPPLPTGVPVAPGGSTAWRTSSRRGGASCTRHQPQRTGWNPGLCRGPALTGDTHTSSRRGSVGTWLSMALEDTHGAPRPHLGPTWSWESGRGTRHDH